jgi:hypothetical protein
VEVVNSILLFNNRKKREFIFGMIGATISLVVLLVCVYLFLVFP